MRSENHPIRVLVADDDQLFTTLMCGCLEEPHFSTTVVATGAEALEKLFAEQFDIVLADLDMPCIDGFRMIGLIKGRPSLSHLAILVVTGSRSLADKQEAHRLGADGFLSKPLDWAAMPRLVRGVVDAKRSNAKMIA